MPALPVITDAFLITQHLNADTVHPMINRFCVLNTAGVMLSTDVANFALSYKNRFLPNMSSDQVMGNTDVLPLDGTSSTTSWTTASAGSAGGNASGTDLPEACAQVITWQTGVRGRSHRGRTYLPGVRSNIVVDVRTNQLTTGATTALSTAAAAFIADLHWYTPTLNLQVLSIKLGVCTPVTHGRGNSYVGIQRRRYEKVAHS